MTINNITVSQIDKMKHCIGFPEAVMKGKITGVKHRKYEAYRNYYTTGNPLKELDDLCEIGLMVSQKHNGGGDDPKAYFVTQSGFEFLGKLLGVQISEMD